jgi:hypothetical protein
MRVDVVDIEAERLGVSAAEGAWRTAMHASRP